MDQDAPENYFCYLPKNSVCQTLGCTLQSSGFTQVARNANYPVAVHPKDHHFNWRRGRILHAYQIVYISEGRGRLEFGRSRQMQPVSAGSVFVLFPNVWHRYEPERASGWTEHWVECTGTAFEMAQNSGLIDPMRPYYDAPDVAQIEKVFAEIHYVAQQDAIGQQLQLSMLALQQLAALASPRNTGASKTARLVNSARMLLMESCTSNAPLEEISDTLGVSYSYLRRSFRSETGMSMKEFQLSIRIQRAQDLLDNSEMSVKEIAGRLGFSSAFHFSSQFRKLVGHPPSEWRTRTAT